MQIEQGPPPSRRGGSAARIKQFLVRVAALIVGAAVLVGALILSIAFFAVALGVVLVVGGYLWWKTRHVRRQMRANFARRDVIEGTAVDISDRDPRS